MQDVKKDQQRLCRRYITTICEECGPDEPGTRNIPIVGKQGCGKSSFIDSVAAALSQDCWVEHAIVGDLTFARLFTNFIVQYRKCCNVRGPQYDIIQLPTLIDVPGFVDTEASEQMKRVFACLCTDTYESGFRVYRDCQMDWDDLLVKYSRAYDDMEVDRVIFVASAVNNLAHRLMKRVRNAARLAQGFKRKVPVCGVMTKTDRVNDENKKQVEAKKEEFKSALGLHEKRFLCCSNYCDDRDADKVRQDRLIPHLHLPTLRFFREMCDAAW